MTAAYTVEYGNFDGGDWGRLSADKAAKNQFSATNCLVYRTGEIGVRAGVRDISPTGLANGAVWHLGLRPGSPTDFWFGQGAKVRYFSALPPTGAVSSTAGSLGGTPARAAVTETGGTSYIQTPANNGYSFDGSTLTALASMPNGAGGIAVYGDRIVVVSGTNSNVIRYSAAADPTSWPAGNTLTVGDVDYITALIAQRGYLSLLKRGSSFYVLTGVPGVNDTLRAVHRAEGPGFNGYGAYAAAARQSDDLIYFVPDRSASPATFDGARTRYFDNVVLPNVGGSDSIAVIPLRSDDPSGVVLNQTAVAADGSAQQVWVQSRGAWTKHTFGVSVAKFGACGSHPYPQNGTSTVADIQQGSLLCFTDGGGASANPKFYGWQPFMDRPGLESDPFSLSCERSGDDDDAHVVGTLDLPMHTDDLGRELVVRRVTVHFRSWDTGASDDTSLSVSVRSFRQYEGTQTDSATQTWSAAPSSSSTGGTYRRKDFGIAPNSGSAFQVRMSGLKGVAISRVLVHFDALPVR